MSKTPEDETASVELQDELPKNEEPLPHEPSASSAEDEPGRMDKFWNGVRGFLEVYDFPLMIVASIGLAKAYPPLGADYLQPNITASWIAVALIFFLMGITLKTEELTKSFKRIKFNSFVQIYNFFAVSAIVFGVSRALVSIGIVTQPLADGMVICACMPVSINSVVVLTASAKGDEAAAVFQAVFGNMVGIILSPLLILGYLGKSGNISLKTVFYQLTLRVIVPVIVGQVLRFSFQAVINFAKKYKYFLSKAQQYLLDFTVYTVFCTTFASGTTAGIGNVFLMILFQLLLMIVVKVLAWYLLRLLFPNESKLCVAGLYSCIQKTIALGIPLIQSIYENNPNRGLYTLPILVWHPMQLVVGSLLRNRLGAFVDREQERLGIKDDQLQPSARTEVDESPEDVETTVAERPESDGDHDQHPEGNDENEGPEEVVVEKTGVDKVDDDDKPTDRQQH